MPAPPRRSSRRHSPASGTCELEDRLIDLWYSPQPDIAATKTLAATAVHYWQVLTASQAEYARRAAAGERSSADEALERVIFALVATFVCKARYATWLEPAAQCRVLCAILCPVRLACRSGAPSSSLPRRSTTPSQLQPPLHLLLRRPSYLP